MNAQSAAVAALGSACLAESSLSLDQMEPVEKRGIHAGLIRSARVPLLVGCNIAHQFAVCLHSVAATQLRNRCSMLGAWWRLTAGRRAGVLVLRARRQ